MSNVTLTPQDLPPTWSITTLGAVVDYGRTSKAEPSEMQASDWILELEDIEKDSSRLLQRLTFGERQSKSTKSRFEAGDVLYGKLRPYLNKVLIADQPGYCTTEIIPIKSGEYLDSRYLFYWLKHPAFLAYVEAESHGMNMPRLGTDTGRAAPFVLAPRAEQTHIANQLDTLLARVNACNDRLDAIPGILKRFRQAVLRAATTGDLTDEWRAANAAAPDIAKLEVQQRIGCRRDKQPSNKKFKEPSKPDLTHWTLQVPPSWAVESISAFAECLDHQRVPVTKEKRAVAQGLYPYYGANGQVDMVDDFLFDDELVLVTEDETFYGREKPIAYRSSGRCWVNNHAHVLLAGDIHRADYLCFALMFYDVQPWLTGTTGRAKLTQGALNALPIAVPPQAEIEAIARRVKNLFALADRIEARLNTARTHAKRLAPRLLAKAFRGELVQQNPQDEPAKVLLQRIACAQPAKVKTSRGRPRTQKKELPFLQAQAPSDWLALPDGAWNAPADLEGHAAVVLLTAVLKAWRAPMPQEQARLAALLCQQPRLLTAVLPADEAAQWRRLVGVAADTLPAQVARFQPATNSHWRRALAGMRTRSELVESDSGAQETWALGAGAAHIETAGWPDGRAQWVVAYLQAHGMEAILPLLEPVAREFVNVRAA